MTAGAAGRAAVAELAARVPPADAAVAAAVAQRWDALAKPPGSLGGLERLAVRVAAAAGTPAPPVPERPALLVCAADHGVHAQGVTPWPQAITTAMAEVIADGRAASNALARTVGATVTVLDVGCTTPPSPRPGLLVDRVRPGTADLSVGPAMRADEACAAVLAGARAAERLLDAGADLLVLGDMGIANTTASAALIAALTGAAAADVVGRGAGADAEAVLRKVAAVGSGLARLRSRDGTAAGADVGGDAADALIPLAEVGGLEHGALAGAALAAAARRVPVLLDGVITDAAALVAAGLAPAVVDHLVAGHRSAEPGASVALAHLRLHPLLDLGLRLGEGTGALLAVPLVTGALAALTQTAAIADLA